jgi:chromosome segregation ATPase
MFFRKSIRIADLEARVQRFSDLYYEYQARYNAAGGANNILREKVKCATSGQSAADKRASELEAELAKARNTISNLQYSLREHDDALDERLRIIDAQAKKIRRLAYIINNPGFVEPKTETIPEHVQPWTMDRPTEYVYTQSVGGK